MIADAFSFLAGALVVWVPERQPWRAIVVGLYVLAAVAASALVCWLA